MRELLIRPSCQADIATLRAMHVRSFRVLGAAFYSAEQIEAATAEMNSPDPDLVAGGTYWVAEIAGAIAGSAGFMEGEPDYAAALDIPPVPLPRAARPVGIVRSVFVDPLFARRGLGRALMAKVEAEMRALGLRTGELMGTLSGVRLYQSLGWRSVGRHHIRCARGQALPVERMLKSLETGSRQLAA